MTMIATDPHSLKAFIEAILNKRNVRTNVRLFDICTSYDEVKLINARLADNFGRYYKEVYVIDTIEEISKIYTQTLNPTMP